MSPFSRTNITHSAWVGPASAALAVFFGPLGLGTSVRAEVPAAAHFVAPIAAETVAAPQQSAPAPTPTVQANCSASAALSRFDYPLRRTARRLANGDPLTIVAIGSSSTAGAGASSPATNYPSRLAVELKQRFPRNDITVLNRGVNGEESSDMLARFDTDVMAEHPQLVLWQVGTNSVLRHHSLRRHGMQLHEGIEELKASGIDTVLIDPQYAPKVLAKSEIDGMVEQIATAAKEESVDLFRRFAIMRDWQEEQHMPFDTFVSPDQLHMNDWSYACVAKLLATAITEAATRPIASAARAR
jgi:acyl-CoA thioesterase I